jgi:hypothetical protein
MATYEIPGNRLPSKADLVRMCIMQVKRPDDNVSEQKQTAIEWAVETLGMQYGLAKVYVNNNWDKV